MPVYNSQAFANVPGGHQITHVVLAINGPILDISVTIPQALANLYARQQIPLPSPIAGIALSLLRCKNYLQTESQDICLFLPARR